MIVKNVNNVKLNTKIASAILNVQRLKIIFQYRIVCVVTGITKKRLMKT